MRCRSPWLIIATAVAWFAGASVSGAQGRILWRDHVRQHGDTNILVELCGPIAGLKEIVEVTRLTVEGTITVAEGKLTAKGDEVYTEYEIDVIRVPKSQRLSLTAWVDSIYAAIPEKRRVPTFLARARTRHFSEGSMDNR